MNASIDPLQIDVAPTSTGWTVFVREDTQAMFVGERARHRAVQWALAVAESLQPLTPILVVIGDRSDRPPTRSDLQRHG